MSTPYAPGRQLREHFSVNAWLDRESDDRDLLMRASGPGPKHMRADAERVALGYLL